jgi:hypothetical protein
MTWWLHDGPLLPTLTVFESEKERPVVYDHNGQPYIRPKPPMGFIDPNRLPTPTPSGNAKLRTDENK